MDGVFAAVRSLYRFSRTVFVVVLGRLRRRALHPAWSPTQEIVFGVFRASARAEGKRGAVRAHALLPSPPRWLLPRAVGNEPSSVAGLPAEVTTPRGWCDTDPVVLYLHGGGYGVCSPGTHRMLVAELARASGAKCVAIDYRLAPAHPFPAALHDSLAAYRALRATIPASRLFLAGDSAGGGLAAATCLALRDAGDSLPAGAYLMSPWLDLTVSEPSIDENIATDYLDRELLELYARNYCGDRAADDPLISPVHGDLSGLPPLLIQAGELEILRDESVTFARRAGEAGVEVSLEVEPAMIHVYPAFGRLVPAASAALARAGAWIRARSEAEEV